MLRNAGYECYVPIKAEIHDWSDRKKLVERVLIPHHVFVRCTEAERMKSFEAAPGRLRGYLNEREPRRPSVVPDREMENFRRMVDYGQSEISITQERFRAGDHVRVTEGPLKDMECELVSVGAKRCIIIRLGQIGAVKMEINKALVRKI